MCADLLSVAGSSSRIEILAVDLSQGNIDLIGRNQNARGQRE